MRPATAASVLRWWTRLYTAGLPRAERESRRAEVESDLWESLRDPVGSRQIWSRLFLGAVDDVSWSITSMEQASRSSLWWSVGSLLTVSAVAVLLISSPDSAAMRETMWAWPAAKVLHVLGLVALVGLRLFIDLRLIGGFLGAVPVATLVQSVTPWTVGAALVTVATGLALFVADPNLLAANTLFRLKVAALGVALVNLWYLHAVALRGVAEWDANKPVPPAARASSYLSLILWVSVIGISLLVPFAT